MYHAGASPRSSYLPSEERGIASRAFGASEAGTRRRRSRDAPLLLPETARYNANEICSRRDWENRTANRYYVAERSSCDKLYRGETRKTDHSDCRGRNAPRAVTAHSTTKEGSGTLDSQLSLVIRSVKSWEKMVLTFYKCITIACKALILRSTRHSTSHIYSHSILIITLALQRKFAPGIPGLYRVVSQPSA